MRNQENNTAELSVTSITVHYTQTINLKQDSRSFYDAIKFCFETPGIKEFTPVKVTLNDDHKTLYFAENKFGAYIAGYITYEELIEATECDGIYRNILGFETLEKNQIESEQLWKRKSDELILIDDDVYVCIQFCEKNFLIV